MIQAYDVAIVGAGPIGLSMAQALSGTGLSIALIEKQSQANTQNPAPDGREIAITHRTKSIMQDLHQWQRIMDTDVHFLQRAEVYNGTSPFVLGFDKPERVHGKQIETLGYLVSNHNIRKAAYDALFDDFVRKNITTFFDTTITHIQTHHTHTTVQLSTGISIRTQLVIAADSRVSFMRKALGISSDMHDFGRTVMVFRTTHTKSNHQTAHEGFYYGSKTLAVLPLGEYQSSMVITIDNMQVDTIKSKNNEQLAAMLESWLGGRLGQMTVSSAIFDYPLLGVHARRFYAPRAALVGDAAVGMHPVTAHGYNLGMESVAILGDLITQAVLSSKDFADIGLLRRYSHTHSLKTRPMYHGTNAIVKLYTAENPAARAVRHLGLRFGQGFLPIKKIITDQLTG